ncbi:MULTISPECIES: hypothetical protein [unclassified Bacillus (in: firmicutes)]|uniref:hypothetical protein n=1 Tax=unclassified Bacillus (in: firmicutes) TaxID=185979 RepID=UPI001FCDECD4|nr:MULTISPECIES: hypothetical protein [unclassified Bacillus (in: firmicutes)]
MMSKQQYAYRVAFYLSNGKEVSGRITHHEDPETYLKAIEGLIEKEKPILIKKLGTIIQSKYITHVKIVEVIVC